MSTERQPWRSSCAEGLLSDPEQPRPEFGGRQPAARSAGSAPASLESDPALRYCSFCWQRLRAAATACDDCGRSVAEMEAEIAAHAEADRKWVPPRRRAAAAETNPEVPLSPILEAALAYEAKLAGAPLPVDRLEFVEETPVIEPAPVQEPPAEEKPAVLFPTREARTRQTSEFDFEPPPRYQPLVDDVELDQPRSQRAWGRSRPKKNRRRVASHPLVLAGGAAVFIVASAWVGVWVAFATFPPAPIPTPPPDAGARQGAVSPARRESVRLQWRNPFPELRLALLASTGEPLATSVDNPGETRLRIAPGAYRLRVAEPTGRWPGVEVPVNAVAGEMLSLKPSIESVAAFYLWRGKELYAGQKPRTAERAWRRAIHVYPDGIEARLELVEMLTARRRYDEAREELQEVLKRAPADERALRLEEALEAKAPPTSG